MVIHFNQFPNSIVFKFDFYRSIKQSNASVCWNRMQFYSFDDVAINVCTIAYIDYRPMPLETDSTFLGFRRNLTIWAVSCFAFCKSINTHFQQLKVKRVCLDSSQNIVIKHFSMSVLNTTNGLNNIVNYFNSCIIYTYMYILHAYWNKRHVWQSEY